MKPGDKPGSWYQPPEELPHSRDCAAYYRDGAPCFCDDLEDAAAQEAAEAKHEAFMERYGA